MIINKTKNIVVCKEKKLLSSIISKAIGLMFSKKRNIGFIFLFTKSVSIDLHMFFVFYPIDIIFLDKDKKVIELLENFKPFTIYRSKTKIKYFIELPSGTINKTKTEVKDKVVF